MSEARTGTCPVCGRARPTDERGVMRAHSFLPDGDDECVGTGYYSDEMAAAGDGLKDTEAQR